MEEGHEGFQPEGRECASCNGANPHDASFCCYCGDQLPELVLTEGGGEDQKEEVFTITKAAVRVKGKHVHGEAWYGCNTGVWYFLSSPDSRNHDLLPRRKEKPAGPQSILLRSMTVKTK